MMRSSPASCLSLNFRGPYNPRALSVRPPNIPTAKAAAAPRLSSGSRVRAELECSSSSATSATGIPPFVTSLSPERAACKAFDEAVQERVVEQCQRICRNERRREERLPEEDVAADEVVGNPGRDRPLLRRRDERERVDELVHAEREGEDDDREDARQGDGQDDPVDRLQPRAAVDERRVLELLRNRLEEPHEEPGRKRDREGRVHEDERPQRVLQVEVGDDPRERQEEERRRGGGDEEKRGCSRLTPAPRGGRQGK